MLRKFTPKQTVDDVLSENETPVSTSTVRSHGDRRPVVVGPGAPANSASRTFYWDTETDRVDTTHVCSRTRRRTENRRNRHRFFDRLSSTLPGRERNVFRGGCTRLFGRHTKKGTHWTNNDKIAGGCSLGSLNVVANVDGRSHAAEIVYNEVLRFGANNSSPTYCEHVAQMASAVANERAN